MILDLLKKLKNRNKGRGQNGGRPEVRSETPKKQARWGESGNVFFTLFGAVALVGVVGVATSTLMRGPVGTVVKLNQTAKADAQMQIAHKLALLESVNNPANNNGDCDDDTFVEPIGFETCANGLVGGGCLPAIGASTNDPWGTRYGFCSWNHGLDMFTAGVGSTCSGDTNAANVKKGSFAGNADQQIVLAVISAGPDRTFQTTCGDDGSVVPPQYVGKQPGSDDLIVDISYAGAVQATGGLWALKSTDPDTASIGNKNIEVGGEARFSSGGQFSGGADNKSFALSNAALEFGANSLLLLPDQNTVGSKGASTLAEAGASTGPEQCEGSTNSGSLRINTGDGALMVLEICDSGIGKGWTQVGGSGSSAGSAGTTAGDIQYRGTDAGAFDADPGTFTYDSASDTLSVPNIVMSGTLDGGASGDVDINDDLAVAGNISLTGNLSDSGDSTVNVSDNLDVSGDITTSTGTVSGNALSGGTGGLAVTGSSTLAGTSVTTLDVTTSISNTTGSASVLIDDALSVSGDTSVTGDVDVTGNITATLDADIEGDVIARSFRLDGDGGSFDEGLYYRSAGGLELRNNGSAALSIDGMGDVGIGISSPTTSLDVAGEIRLRSAAAGVDAGVPCGSITGAITYVSGDLLLVCSSVTGNWETIGTSGGGGGGIGGLWTEYFDYIAYENSSYIVKEGSDISFASAALEGAGTRLLWYPSAGALRAGTVSGSQWDETNIGQESMAFGYDTVASGDTSIALGNNAQATTAGAIALGTDVEARATQSVVLGNEAIVAAGATNSMALGLGDATGAAPTVQGANSLGVFMGNQSGMAAFNAANTVGIFGGDVILSSGVNQTAASGSLLLDVEGKVGATSYCDPEDAYCFTAEDVATGSVGVPGADTEVLFNSGGSLGSDPGFVYLRSTDYLGLGAAIPAEVLHLSSAYQLAIRLENTNAPFAWNIQHLDDGSLLLDQVGAGLDEFALTSAGRLGLGTLTPNAQLELTEQLLLGTVNDCTAATQGALRLNATSDVLEMCDFVGAGGYVAIGGATVSAPGANTQIIYNSNGVLYASSNLVFDNGNVGIGVPVPDDQLDVVGTAQITGALVLGSALDVAGQVTFNSGLDVANATVLSNTLDVTGVTTLNSTLDVTDQVTFASGMDVAQNAIFSGDVGIGDATPDLTLLLDVEGQIGADMYCDENGINCFLPEDVANNTVPGADREVLFNSGGSLGTAPNFYFDSGGDLVLGSLAKPAYMTGNGLSEIYTDGDIVAEGRFVTADNQGFAWDDSTTGIFGNAANDYMRFVTDGADQMYLTSAGKLGLGNTSPATKLDIYNVGSATLSLSTDGSSPVSSANLGLFTERNDVSKYLSEDNSNMGWGVFAYDHAYGAPGLQNDMVFSFWDGASWTGSVAFQSSGRVGFGTNSPNAQVELTEQLLLGTITDCTAATQGALRLNATSDTLQMCDGAGSYVDIGGAGGSTAAPGNDTEIVYNSGGVLYASSNLVFDNGNVGIGTNAPAHVLHVDKTETGVGVGYDILGLASVSVEPTSPQPLGPGWSTGRETSAFEGRLDIPATNTNRVNVMYSLAGTANNSGSGDVIDMRGVNAFAGAYAGSGNVTSLRGSYNEAYADDGNITNATSVFATSDINGGGTSVTNLAGLRVVSNISAGSVANRYGIYLEAPTGTATNDYGVYQVGGQDNYLAGTLGIGPGAVSPVTKLDVDGTIKMAYGGEACDLSREGAIHFDSGSNNFYVCQATANGWQRIVTTGGGGTGLPAAGNNREIMYNSGGVLYGSSSLVFGSAGNVGLGTATPSTLLHVIGATADNNFVATLQNTGADGDLVTMLNNTGDSIFRVHQSANGAGQAFLRNPNATDNAIMILENTNAAATNGPRLRLDHQEAGVGHRYDIVSTGSANGPGAGHLEIIDDTMAATRMVITPDGIVKFSSTGGLVMNIGDTAQRPQNAENGMIRYNTDTDKFEAYQGGTWEDIITSAIGGGAAAPDRGVQFRSGANFAADANFTYTSAGDLIVGSYQLDDTGTGSEDNRMFFDVSKGAFRAGRASNTHWDDASVGNRSIALGDGVIASSQGSMALGNFVYSLADNATAMGYDAQATGDYSLAIGLDNAVGSPLPDVSAQGSMGIFMGNQAGVNLSSARTMALLGGRFVLDPNDTATKTYADTGEQLLEMDIEGDIGAINYCDELGNNCFTASEITALGSGSVPAPGNDREFVFNSGGQFYASADFVYTANGGVNIGQGDFVFTSAGRLGIGTTDPAATLEVFGDTGILAFAPSDAGSLNLSGMGDGTQTGVITLYDANNDRHWNVSHLQASNDLQFGYTDGGFNEHMRLTSAGRLGIGTANPTQLAHLSASDDAFLNLEATGSIALPRDVGIEFSHANGVGAMIDAVRSPTQSDGMYMGFYTSDNGGGALTERMRIRKDGIVEFMSTGAAVLNIGDTSQRPATAENGMIRYNTDMNAFEGFNGTDWNGFMVGSAGSDREVIFNSGGAMAGISTFVYDSAGNLGLGTATPSTILDVSGTLKVADGGETCTVAADGGMVRWNGTLMQYCDGATWQNFANGATASPASPDRGIQYNSGGAFMADANFVYTSAGDLIVGSYQIDDTGSGSEDSRMFFDVSTGAFRAGGVPGNQWNFTSSGQYSVALGYNTVASNWASVAIGDGAQATGVDSVALGTSGAYADEAFAAGHSSIATAQRAVAIGYQAQAGGQRSVALGESAVSDGYGSSALGNSVEASGDYSVALGRRVIAGDGTAGSGFGDGSMAIGLIDASVTTRPEVQGNQSLGIFMGDQDGGIVLASANTMGLFGGRLVIDPTVPATKLYANTGLDVDAAIKISVDGEVCLGNPEMEGAIKYDAGTYYFCADNASDWESISLGAGTLGALSDTNISGPADGELLYYSAGKWENYAIGLDDLTDAIKNSSGSIYIGDFAGTNATGSNNTSVGHNSGVNADGDYNAFYGMHAGTQTTTGYRNTFLGVGVGHFNNTGFENTAVGSDSFLYNSGGSYNTYLGFHAGIADGSNANTAIGHNAMAGFTAPIGANSYNVALGNNALYGNGSAVGTQNVALGVFAGDSLSSGSDNIFLGHNTDAPSPTTSNYMNIGNILFGSRIGTLAGATSQIGTYNYCDESFNNCFTANDVATLASGSVPAPGNDREFVFNSGGQFYASADFAFTADGGIDIGQGNAVFTSAGDLIVGSYQIDDTGAGSEDYRMFFDVSRGAFRAGEVSGAQWDSANVGDHSVAIGEGVIASGAESVAMGQSTTASGDWSVAMGTSTTASNYSTTAFGETTLASGYAATAMGGNNTASGDYSTVMGRFSAANGNQSTASGYSAIADGNYSIALGRNVNASGLSSMALGSYASAGGLASMAIGLSSTNPATDPKVTGDQALGIFMGNQSALNLSSANTMALLGGRFVLDPNVPATKLYPDTGEQLLEMDIEGDIGAINYCDEAGNNCFAASDVASLAAGSVPAPGNDTQIVLNSGGQFYASAGLVFDHTDGSFQVGFNSGLNFTSSGDLIVGSYQKDDTGSGNEDSRMFFDVANSAFRAGSETGSQWDSANIGWGSTAFGDNNLVSGYASFAAGAGNSVVADSSFAAGDSNSIPTGYYNFAFGDGNTVDGDGGGGSSVAMGWANVIEAPAWGAMLFGLQNQAKGDSDAVGIFGYGNQASDAKYSFLTGLSSRTNADYAIAMGYYASAGGLASAAFGQEVTVSGDHSIGFGLGDPSNAARPEVSGTSSYGIFMGAQDSVVLSSSNTMAILGGRFVLDPNVPATKFYPDTGEQLLEMDIEGDIGAINYCDEAGNNCFAASDVASLAAGSVPAPGGDREITFNSGGQFWSDGNFVFTSAGSLGLGTSSPVMPLDVYGAIKFNSAASVACDAAREGAIQYGSGGSKIFEVCADSANGWEQLALGGTVVGNLGDLSDVDTTGFADGEVLMYSAGAGSWVSGNANISNAAFLDLSDTPAAYTAQGGKFARVNSGETAIEFTDEIIESVTGAAAPNALVINDLGDVSVGGVTGGQFLSYDSVSGNWVASAIPTGQGGKWEDGATAGEIYYNSGNVGIGNTDPSHLLDVGTSATMRMWLSNTTNTMNDPFNLGMSNSGADENRRFTLTTEEGTTQAALQFGDGAGSNTVFGIGSSSDSGATWTSQFVVTHSGGVGIGDFDLVDPVTKLDVQGAIKFASTSLACNDVTHEGAMMFGSGGSKIFEVCADNTNGWEQLALGGTVAGAFTDLSDTPSAYTAQAGKFARVNSGETALEFTDEIFESVTGEPAPTAMTLNELGDVSVGGASGGQFLSYDSASGNWVASAVPVGQGGKWEDGAVSGEIYYGSGNVGIGTATPATMLDVAGIIKFGSGSLACNDPSHEGAMQFGSGGSQVFEVCADNTNGWEQLALGGTVGGDLGDLGDVDTTGVANGNILTYSAGNWVVTSENGLWSDSGSGYIDYNTALGGIRVAGQTGLAAPVSGTSGGGGGSSDFVSLTDTPANYSGQGGKLVAVNSGASALEFIDAPQNGLWSDSGSGYIEYSSTLGGVLINSVAGASAPSGALGSTVSSALDGLTDVDTTGKSTSDVLTWDGANWVASAPAGGGLWSDSGSGYIEYSSTLGGVLINSVSGTAAPTGAVASSGGSSDFVSLTDTPANFSGQGGKLVAVNPGATALEFIDAQQGGLWSDTGSGYIEYSSTLGGMMVGAVAGAAQPPTGAVGGSGGSSTLDGLTDVSVASPSNGEILTYSGGNWVAGSASGAGGLWSDSGSGYIEYNNVYGGLKLGTTSGGATPTSNYVDVLNDITNVSAASPTDGDCLAYNNSSGNWESSSTCGSGGATPGGASTQIQFNSGGSALGGDAGLTFNATTDTLSVGSIVNIGGTSGAAAPVGATGAGGGASTLDALTDTTLSSPSNGQVLTYNGSAWVNSAATGVWSDSGAGYIEYSSTLGGIQVGSLTGVSAPVGAVGGSGSGGGLWTAGTGDDIYYDATTPQVGIGNSSPDVALDVTGDIEYTGTLTDVSDRRLKTDIHKLDQHDVVGKLTSLDTYSFRMKADPNGQVEYGVMAQEVKEVFPHLVRTADDEMGTMSVNYIGFVTPLIEASKELKAENDMLKAEIEDMKLAQAQMKDDILREVNGLKAHTGYGVSKAEIGLWMVAGMFGAGGLFFLLGVILRNRQRKLS